MLQHLTPGMCVQARSILIYIASRSIVIHTRSPPMERLLLALSSESADVRWYTKLSAELSAELSEAPLAAQAGALSLAAGCRPFLKLRRPLTRPPKKRKPAIPLWELFPASWGCSTLVFPLWLSRSHAAATNGPFGRSEDPERRMKSIIRN